MSTVTSRPKDRTGAARQARYRQRVKARLQPLTPGKWELLASVFVAGLAEQTPIRRQCATLAFNRLAAARRTGLRVELSDPSTR